MELTGGCLCKAVHYRITEVPVTARACWCRCVRRSAVAVARQQRAEQSAQTRDQVRLLLETRAHEEGRLPRRAAAGPRRGTRTRTLQITAIELGSVFRLQRTSKSYPELPAQSLGTSQLPCWQFFRANCFVRCNWPDSRPSGRQGAASARRALPHPRVPSAGTGRLQSIASRGRGGPSFQAQQGRSAEAMSAPPRSSTSRCRANRARAQSGSAPTASISSRHRHSNSPKPSRVLLPNEASSTSGR